MKLLALLFGCHHSRTTFPQRAIKRNPQGRITWRGDEYVVCLDCGKEMPYMVEGERRGVQEVAQ